MDELLCKLYHDVLKVSSLQAVNSRCMMCNNSTCWNNGISWCARLPGSIDMRVEPLRCAKCFRIGHVAKDCLRVCRYAGVSCSRCFYPGEIFVFCVFDV